MLRIVTLAIFTFYSGFVLSQTELNAKPDVAASFPGGNDSLKAFLKRNIKYPLDAIARNIEGMVFVEFIVEKSGNVNQSSVSVIRRLFPSIDNESIRIVKLLPKWMPALKGTVPIDSKYVLPIEFKFEGEKTARNENAKPPILDYSIKRPFDATVKAKTIATALPNWNIYRESDQINVVGTVIPGTDVIVFDWDHNVYGIKSANGAGFISSSALKPNASLDSLAAVVAIYKNAKNIKETPPPLAHMSLTTVKDTLFTGECVLVDWAFNIAQANVTPMQFCDLETQVPKVSAGPLNIKSTWQRNSFIGDVTPVLKLVGSENYYSYGLCQKVFCPTETRNLQFPSISLKILKQKYNAGSTYDTIQFSSKPLTIKVKPIPPGQMALNNTYLPVGDFTLKDSLFTNSTVEGKPFLYSLTLDGEGNLFPVEPPNLSSANVDAKLVDIIYKDTVIDEYYYSTRSFVYSMLFKKAGTYKFNTTFAFNFFNPWSKKIIKLQSEKSITVQPSLESISTPPRGLYNVYSKMILLDFSESMLMEDYKPNRLTAVKSAIHAFLKSDKRCDVGFLVFAGEAKLLPIATKDSCYTYTPIRNTTPSSFSKPGTAIGNAIWLGGHALKKSDKSIMVIIGDGDGNAGICPIQLAVNFARKYGIKIYTIGVGKRDEVPFGVDEKGKPMFYNETFKDKDLKLISLQTGGKYFWAKDAAAISSILKTIFPQ